MKIRTNFVSNSSSQSFCVVATKKNYDSVLSKLKEKEKAALALFESYFKNDCGTSFTSFRKFAGKNVVVLSFNGDLWDLLSQYFGDLAWDAETEEEAEKLNEFVEKHKLKDREELLQLIGLTIFKFMGKLEKDEDNCISIIEDT